MTLRGHESHLLSEFYICLNSRMWKKTSPTGQCLTKGRNGSWALEMNATVTPQSPGLPTVSLGKSGPNPIYPRVHSTWKAILPPVRKRTLPPKHLNALEDKRYYPPQPTPRARQPLAK